MNEPVATTAADARGQLRRSVYWLLIAAGVGMMLGRIFAIDSVNLQKLEETKLNKIAEDLKEKRQDLESKGVRGKELEEELARCKARWLEKARLCRPFLSANDRSRWCTVRALVEDDMRVEGVPYAIDKVIQQQNWDTIDMVKREGHLYSSKPPLLPTLMAAVYWPIHKITGVTLGTHPYEIDRFMLVLFNVLPLVIYFALLARLIDRFGSTDWGRIFTMAAAVLGTFLSTFAVAVNNHLPAAVCAVAAIYAVTKIWFDDERKTSPFPPNRNEPNNTSPLASSGRGAGGEGGLRARYFILAGFFGALAAFNEFPAASLFAALGVALLWKAPKLTLLGFVPAAVIVAAAFFGANWIAVHSLKPAYLHRGGDDNWYDYTYERNGKTVESYWKAGNQKGLDLGEPSREIYARNCLVWHHGIFSLTPVWLLSVIGMGIWIFQGPCKSLPSPSERGAGDQGSCEYSCKEQTDDDSPALTLTLSQREKGHSFNHAFKRGDPRVRWAAAAIAAISLACIAFYLGQPRINRNYGGVTSGLRWMFWLAPLWLLAMLPAVDFLSTRRWTRGLCLLLLAISVLSVSYPTWNPWSDPWLMVLSKYLGWGV
jgi:hypothetical protein